MKCLRRSRNFRPSGSIQLVESLECRQLLSGYAITDIGPGYATGLNDDGVVIGVLPGPNSTVEHEDAFYWNGASAVQDMTWGGDYGVPLAINDSDEVVGYAGHESANPIGRYAFRIDIDDHLKIGGSDFTFGDSSSSPTSSFDAIDDSFIGLSVGYDSAETGQSVFYNGTTYPTSGIGNNAGFPEGIANYNSATGATGIVGQSDEQAYYNPSGTDVINLTAAFNGGEGNATAISPNGEYVTGTSQFGGAGAGQIPFVYTTSSGDVTQPQDFDFYSGSGLAVNDSGTAVGYLEASSASGATVDEAFVQTSDGDVSQLQHFIPSNTGWILNEATGINSSGQICGYGTLNGVKHAFLLTPNADVSGTVSGGKPGETVYLDANNNSKLDSGELSTTTDSSGYYDFGSVPPGSYVIRQVLPSGYTQTTPVNGFGIHITVTSGQVLAGQDFTDKSTVTGGSVSGTVTGGQADETVYLDANNNAKLDSGELSTTTNSSGAYSFSGVPADAYVIRQVLPNGYTQTSPADGNGIHITVAPGGSITGQNFTDTSTVNGGRISGTVTGGESGETIYLDANNNAKLDSGELSTTTNSGGAYNFSSVPAGVHVIRQVLPSGHTQTDPSDGYGIHVTVTNGSSITGQNFIDSGQVTSGGTIEGIVYTDANASGSQDSGEAGLSGVTLYLDLSNAGSYKSGDPTTTSGSNGSYLFTGLAAGKYIVRAITPSGDSQTQPAGGLGQHVTVNANATVSGVNFGEVQGKFSSLAAGDSLYMTDENSYNLSDLFTPESSTKGPTPNLTDSLSASGTDPYGDNYDLEESAQASETLHSGSLAVSGAVSGEAKGGVNYNTYVNVDVYYEFTCTSTIDYKLSASIGYRGDQDDMVTFTFINNANNATISTISDGIGGPTPPTGVMTSGTLQAGTYTIDISGYGGGGGGDEGPYGSFSFSAS